MIQENLEPPAIAASAGPPCWALLGLAPRALFELAEQVGRLNVFGAWLQEGQSWCRPEPNRRPEDSRIQLWSEDGSCGREAGWYYRFGFGVLCLPGVNSTAPCATADEAKRRMDSELILLKNTVVVEPVL